MIYSECTWSVYDSAETDTLDSRESCVDISTRNN
jgi:hypothetical protein